jgi:hypothetical protein
MRTHKCTELDYHAYQKAIRFVHHTSKMGLTFHRFTNINQPLHFKWNADAGFMTHSDLFSHGGFGGTLLDDDINAPLSGCFEVMSQKEQGLIPSTSAVSADADTGKCGNGGHASADDANAPATADKASTLQPTASR